MIKKVRVGALLFCLMIVALICWKGLVEEYEKYTKFFGLSGMNIEDVQAKMFDKSMCEPKKIAETIHIVGGRNIFDSL